MARNRLRKLGLTNGKETSRWTLTLAEKKREQIHHHSREALSLSMRVKTQIGFPVCLCVLTAEGDSIDCLRNSWSVIGGRPPTGGSNGKAFPKRGNLVQCNQNPDVTYASDSYSRICSDSLQHP